MTIIDEYLQTVGPSERVLLQHIRRVVHELAPNVEETRSYGMPAFKLRGKYLVAFAAFNDHLSLFPTAAPIEAMRDELGDFATSKGTLQFTLERPLPDALIKKVVQYQINRLNNAADK